VSLLILLLLIFLLQAIFPSSGQHYLPSFGEVLAFIVCGVLLLGMGTALLYAAAFISLWIGNISLFPFVLMGVIAASMLCISLTVRLLE
jgi:hypothetical protein